MFFICLAFGAMLLSFIWLIVFRSKNQAVRAIEGIILLILLAIGVVGSIMSANNEREREKQEMIERLNNW